VMDLRETADGPLVSVILTAFAGRGDPAQALRSALAQSCRDVEIIVTSDGRADLADLADARRPPVRLLSRRHGLSRTAPHNEAVAHARGRYVCYLSGQDAYYAHHVRTLAEALESADHCQAAYSDAYTALFRPTADGRREVLGKILLGAREFDRHYLLGHDYIPPVALMHRRELLSRTGGFNERLGVLADWDMHRRLAFFTDFLHVPTITAERYVAQVPGGQAAPAGGDLEDLDGQRLEVLSARPRKPWPRMPDLSIVFAPEAAGARTLAAIEQIRRRTCLPHRLYLALTDAEARLLGDRSAAAAHVPVGAGWPWDARADKAIRQCEGDCIAVLPESPAPAPEAIEAACHVLTRHAGGREAVRLGPPNTGAWGAVFRRQELLRARRNHPALSIRRSVEAEGIVLRPAGGDELPLAFDVCLWQARAAEKEGSFLEAARLYESAGRRHGNGLWMSEAAAGALYRHGRRDDQALRACREVNQLRPTVSSLLLEARLLKRNHQVDRACRLLERAGGILDWTADREEQPC
jgi:hypothetical protein